jgi:hypothetical protein
MKVLIISLVIIVATPLIVLLYKEVIKDLFNK